MRNFVQPGRTLTLPAPYDLASGAPAQVGAIFGVSNGAALAGQPADLDVEGVFTLDKVAANAFTVGDAVFFAAGTKLATSVASGNQRIGVATEPAAAGTASVIVRLNGTF
ncbi:DUF2190 family protein [Pararoseomonas sp. SCSIO 73927]|uniref:DUF2190 family protein n=1 Tax=Pararoseomonas sp. SCSIO 73927 TaxID=3114537 RepID=UPI0030CE02C1